MIEITALIISGIVILGGFACILLSVKTAINYAIRYNQQLIEQTRAELKTYTAKPVLDSGAIDAEQNIAETDNIYNSEDDLPVV